jgi:AsmA protein
VLVNINADNGLVKIPNLDMQAYQGSISNNITLDARKAPLKLQISNNISKLSIGPVLTDFAQSDALTGSLSSSSNLTATGQSIHSIVNSLNGTVQLALSDGVIKGIDAAQQMCETVNKISSLGGVVKTTQSVDKSTAFATIKGLLNFKNGVISNNDFKADLDALNATGKGSINLAAQSLDYRVGLTIQENLFKKSCSVNNKIQNIEWPVNCRGNFSDDPLKMCKPDLSVVEDILKNALKAELEKKLGASIKQKQEELKQELKNKVEEKAKDKLKDALKGLF